MIKVDKNVPIPPAKRQTIYPWAKLEIGDSFFIPGKTAGKMGGIFASAKALDHKYTARTVVENGVKGARVWRVS